VRQSLNVWWRLAATYTGTAGLQTYLFISTGQLWAIVLSVVLAMAAVACATAAGRITDNTRLRAASGGDDTPRVDATELVPDRDAVDGVRSTADDHAPELRNATQTRRRPLCTVRRHIR
jgi:hypothetical protein